MNISISNIINGRVPTSTGPAPLVPGDGVTLWQNIFQVGVGLGEIWRNTSAVNWANKATFQGVNANQDCVLKFKSLNPTYAIGMMGFTQRSLTPSQSVPSWNWYFHSHANEKFAAAEGYTRLAYSLSFGSIADVWEIRRTMQLVLGVMEGVFTYYRNGSLYATSSTYYSGEIDVSPSMYHLDIKFVDISLQVL